MAFLTRVLYSGRGVSIGKHFRTDSIPRILIDKNCSLSIGGNVEFRRNIEIRIHNNSSLQIGHNTRIDRGVRFLSANNSTLTIGDGTRIGLNAVFNGGDTITIGKKCLISGFVYIQTSMHGFAEKLKPVQEQGYQHAPILLQDDCWLGTHVVVLPGLTLGKGAVVGSNAVVNKDVNPYEVVGGIPAKAIKNRN